MFYIDTINNKKFLKSSVLAGFEPDFTHLFTTRESVVKTKDAALENTANSNLEMILGHLQIEKENFYRIKQTHSTNIAINPKNTDIIDDTDGIVISKPKVATVLHFADCTPVLLYDPKNRVAAGLHAGWRGTAGAISKKGVEILKENFNSNPKDIIAAIGPCIGQEDFETGIEVYEALKATVKLDMEDKNGPCEADETFKTELFKFRETPESPITKEFPGNTENAKVFPNLAKINARQLWETGVKTIDICHFKTYSDNDILFSYRKENKTTSRISMVLKLG